ncbi:MAG: hypothetical protein NT067_06900 [Candidatus Diapherotrites archaeon]|nr:hypothetical protein [Candidatus Diapherotrites archaeon]
MIEMLSKRVPYPKDLMDIVTGLVFSGAGKEEIFNQLTKDQQLKEYYCIKDEQILSAIEDSFFIFDK